MSGNRRGPERPEPSPAALQAAAGRFNGSAQMTGTDVRLTSARRRIAGSVVYDVPQPSDGLPANFTTSMGGGTGGDGLTLALLDPASADTSAIGLTRPALGLGGRVRRRGRAGH